MAQYTVTFSMKDEDGIKWVELQEFKFDDWSYAEDYINERIEQHAGKRLLFTAKKMGEALCAIYEVFLNSEVKHTWSY